MSFSLSVSGHVSNAEQAVEVDDLVKSKGRDLVEAIRELGVEPSSAYFSGPSGSTNFLDEVPSGEVENQEEAPGSSG